MDYDRKAAEHLLGDELTPQKAVSLTYAATELGEEDPLYDVIEHEVDQYLESTKEVLKGFSSTGEKIPLSDLRGLLQERRERFEEGVETAFGLDESNRQKIDEVQQSYLFHIRDDIIHNGDSVELLQN